MEITLKPTPRQHIAWEAWNNNIIDDVVYGGSAGGGKTHCGCEMLMISALQYPGTKYFIGRKELKTLMMSSYITLTQKVFPMHGLEQGKHWWLDGKYNVVHFKNGSTIALLDLAYAPTDPLYDRFGSHEYTRGWIEEASECEFKAYDVLKSRVGRYRNEELGIKNKLLLTLNPSQDWPYRIFYTPWKKAGRPVDPKHPLISVHSIVDGVERNRTFIFVPALYKDNPWVGQQYITNLATISDPVMRERLMQGDWEYASAHDALFNAAGIADLFTNTPAYSQERFMTVDVARFGRDKIVLTKWIGWNAFKVDIYSKKSVPETADLVRTDMNKWGIPVENTLIDADGVGGGVFDMLPGTVGFAGGAAPFGIIGEKAVRENYDNLRTQCIYHLSEKVEARQVSITEQSLEVRELLAADLQQLKRRDPDQEGKLKVTKKEDIKDALGRSPDVGDTLMMRSYFDLRKRDTKFQGGGEMTVSYADL